MMMAVYRIIALSASKANMQEIVKMSSHTVSSIMTIVVLFEYFAYLAS
jgi:hypothetical protein